MSILNCTDSYKRFHMLGYAPGTTSVYSYMCPRSDRYFPKCVFFGLQYYLKEYLSKPITESDLNAFVETQQHLLGEVRPDILQKIEKLVKLGHWPLEIRALPEGTIIPVKNAILTIRNTHPDFHWCVGYIESLLLKIWYPITVATNVLQYKNVLNGMLDKTDKDSPLRDWLISDFGYRSDTSEESAAISGAAHLLFFKSSDTICALPFINKYYKSNKGTQFIGSVYATEHSLASSFTKEGEFDYFSNMLDLVPSGILSLVSDTYDIWRVCTDYLPRLKEKILSREGKVVIRPDSGNPPDIICGNLEASLDSPANKGVLRLLDETFGHTVNEQGYKVLNNKIGLIYGDGMYLQRYTDTLNRMKDMGYAASNLVVGIGGILRQGTRDTLGFALKATHVEVNGQHKDILKTPVTDVAKHSHCGYMKVFNDNGIIKTQDRVSFEESNTGLLRSVFLDGKIIKDYTFDEVIGNTKRGI
jgi:nicotinamide phosphoribosyltransferase